MEDCYMAKATERIFLPLIRLLLPEIVDINLPVEGVFHNLAIVSIRKRFPFHARKVMNALWGMGQMMFTKVIIVMDDGVNIQDAAEVIWRAANNIDPKRDIMFVEGPVDVLNPAVAHTGFGSKMGIDATKKWEEEGFSGEWPRDIAMLDEIKTRVDALLANLGLNLPR
jgi:4-hydroxy-3-polyprenylbenzoate decarboxylase